MTKKQTEVDHLLPPWLRSGYSDEAVIAARKARKAAEEKRAYERVRPHKFAWAHLPKLGSHSKK